MAKAPSRSRVRQELLDRARAVRVDGRCDVVVLGAGASGLCAAISAAETGASVWVLERALFPGQPILATGNGRCNLTNARIDAQRYNAPDFVSSILGEDAQERILAFFSACGLACAWEEDRCYPRSFSAASVRDVLVSRAERAGVRFACAREALSVETVQNGMAVGFRGIWDDAPITSIEAGAVVVALGGGAPLLESLGCGIVPFRRVLCAIAVADGWTSAVDGRRARARASLLRNGERIACESGELLFRNGALSGIMAFDLSRFAQPGDTIEVDLLPDIPEHSIEGLVDRLGADCAPGLLDPVIASALIERADGDARNALLGAKTLVFKATGLLGDTNAQVTHGGLPLASFDPTTLIAHDGRPLLACGEALDVDGPCGGFNLSWAWLSGIAAGANAAALAVSASTLHER